jgi:hypothetical protein
MPDRTSRRMPNGLEPSGMTGVQREPALTLRYFNACQVTNSVSALEGVKYRSAEISLSLSLFVSGRTIRN